MRQCEERQKPSVFGFWKGFVVAASNKVIYKFIGTHYAIVVGGANAAKSKCKAVSLVKDKMKKVNTGVCR